MHKLLRQMARSGDHGKNGASHSKAGGEDLGEQLFGEGRAETRRLLEEQKKRALNPPRVFAVRKVEINIYFYAAIILSLFAGLLLDRYWLSFNDGSDVVITKSVEDVPHRSSSNTTNSERLQKLQERIRGK